MTSDAHILLVDCFRKIVSGRGHCPHLARALGILCQCDGADLVRTIAIFLSAVDNGCRTTVTVGCSGGTAFTPSEMQLLAILAAAQDDDRDLLQAHLDWLVRAPHQRPVAIAARLVARLFRAGGVEISHPRDMPEALQMRLSSVA